MAYCSGPKTPSRDNRVELPTSVTPDMDSVKARFRSASEGEALLRVMAKTTSAAAMMTAASSARFKGSPPIAAAGRQADAPRRQPETSGDRAQNEEHGLVRTRLVEGCRGPPGGVR